MVILVPGRGKDITRPWYIRETIQLFVKLGSFYYWLRLSSSAREALFLRLRGCLLWLGGCFLCLLGDFLGGGCSRGRGYYLAVAQMDGAVGDGGKLFIVGDDDEGLSEPGGA